MENARATILMGNSLALAGPELKPGDTAPDFDLTDNSLKSVKLADTGRQVRIFSVIPSVDTPVCEVQTRRFNQEAAQLGDVAIYTISMDLPFAQKRWCGAEGIDKIKLLSDYRTGTFGESYGTLIQDLRLESRAIFVIDQDNKIRYVEYVPEVGQHPNYDAALAAAQSV